MTDEPKTQENKDAVVKLQTPMEEVEYNGKYKLANGSIMQLLHLYTHRLEKQTPEPDNKWQVFVYPDLTKLFQTLRDAVTEKVVELSKDYDADVVRINFCGYKNFKLPLMVQTRGVHFRTTYEHANVRHVLKSLEQRLNYLSSAPLPTRYQEDTVKQLAFSKVQELAKLLLSENLAQTVQSWQTICEKAGEVSGFVPDDNRKHVRKQRFDRDRDRKTPPEYAKYFDGPQQSARQNYSRVRRPDPQNAN